MNLPTHFTPINSREQLLSTLAEAAEIEHNLMCCYLYAAFSLKRGLEEYSYTEEGALYGIQGCPVHESPLHLIPP